MSRPPQFERHEVLAEAAEVFWQRGYRATSINDLVAATGLRPGSLYAAFGSKKGLFLEALQQYNQRFIEDLEAGLADADSPLGALRAIVERMAETALCPNGERGCLAVNTLLEMAQHDADIAVSLRAHNERLRAMLQQLLDEARDRGELPAAQDTKSLSVFVLNNLWGLRVLCKSLPTRSAVDSITDGVMSAITPGP